MASISALVDDFNGTFVDGVLWTASGSSNIGNIFTTNNQLNITHGAASETNRLSSVATYDLTGGAAYVQVKNYGNQSQANHSTQFYLQLDGNNYLVFYTGGTTLNWARNVAATFTPTAVGTISGAHNWLRIRESGGTVFWDTSSDGNTWTNTGSIATPFAITALTVILQSGTSGDTLGNQSIFDNFNTPDLSPYSYKPTRIANRNVGPMALRHNFRQVLKQAAESIAPPPPTGLTFVGANAAATTSVTIPAHQVGDLILIAAINAGNFTTTLPTIPTAGGTVPAWNSELGNAGSNNTSMRVCSFVATATNHTSGTWTTATLVSAVVIRGQDATTPIGGKAEAPGANNVTTSIAPAITMTNTDGTSILIQFHTHTSYNPPQTPPAGYTQRVDVDGGGSTGAGVIVNTKDDTTSDGAVTQQMAVGISDNRGAQIEVLVQAPPSGTITAALQVLSMVSTGAQTQTGTMVATMAPATASLTGVMQPSGTIAAALQLLTMTSSGGQTQTGTIAANLKVAIASLTGVQTQTGTITSTIAPAIATLTGVMQPSGTIATTLQPAIANLTGVQIFTGTIASTMVRATMSAAGVQIYTGIITASPLPLISTLTGVMLPSGTIATSLQPVQSSLTGVQIFTGTIATAMQHTLASITAVQIQTGTIASSLQFAQASLTGVMQPSGTVVVALQVLQTSLTGQQTQTGIMAATLQLLVFSATAVEGYQISADLAITSSPTVTALRNALVDASLGVSETATATIIFSALLSADQIITALLTPSYSVTKTQYISAPSVTITETSTPNSLRNARVDAALAAIATATGEQIMAAFVDADIDVQAIAGLTAGGLRDAAVGAALSVTANFLVSAATAADNQVNLAITAITPAVMAQAAHIAADLAVTAASTAIVNWDTTIAAATMPGFPYTFPFRFGVALHAEMDANAGSALVDHADLAVFTIASVTAKSSLLISAVLVVAANANPKVKVDFLVASSLDIFADTTVATDIVTYPAESLLLEVVAAVDASATVASNSVFSDLDVSTSTSATVTRRAFIEAVPLAVTATVDASPHRGLSIDVELAAFIAGVTATGVAYREGGSWWPFFYAGSELQDA